jgi:hypothetical protein
MRNRLGKEQSCRRNEEIITIGIESIVSDLPSHAAVCIVSSSMTFLMHKVLTKCSAPINTSDEVQEQVRRTSSNLEQFCIKVLESSDKMLPSDTRRLEAQNPLIASVTTFTLQEANISENKNALPRVICPRARLPVLSKIQRDFKLEFRCFCRDSDHSGQLNYIGESPG